jgi:predicted RNA-binding protein with PIN domain
MEYLIVDGYNIINAWGDVFTLEKDSLEDCRVKLLDILSNYQVIKHE